MPEKRISDEDLGPVPRDNPGTFKGTFAHWSANCQTEIINLLDPRRLSLMTVVSLERDS